MRNFIRKNIENVNRKKAVSIERDNPKQSNVTNAQRTNAPRNVSMA
jgi:hypothetical protein